MNQSFPLSVVIPAYNAESTLGRALNSVLSQTCPANEIIVVDDGSTDGTAKVAESFGESVNFFRKENGGSSSARNFGISKCQYDWVAFLDSDDAWLPCHNEHFRDLLLNHPELHWAFGRYEIEKNGQRVRLSSLGCLATEKQHATIFDPLNLLATKCSIWTGAVVVRRSFLKEVGGFDERQKTSHDTDLWFRLALAHRQIGFASQPVAKYNVGNTNSLTGLAAYGNDESWILSIQRFLKMAETLEPKDRQLVNQFVRFKSNQKLRNTIRYGNTAHARWLLREYRQLHIAGIARRYQLLALLPTNVIRSMQWLFLTARSFLKKLKQPNQQKT